MSANGVLKVGGFVPFTTVDFPGRLSAVIFCQGCTWHCRYCHNPHLQPFALETPWTWETISAELSRRRGFLEAVVFSGGEPTAQHALLSAIREVKEMGFLVGLHTSGAFPGVLAEALPLVDWVGLDVKGPFDARHDRITGCDGSVDSVQESLELLLRSGVDYELRTTVHPRLLDERALDDLRHELARQGARPSKIQTFRPEGCVDSELLAFHAGAT